MPEVEGDYHYLCLYCGFITRHEQWTAWEYDETYNALVPIESDTSDPILRCPVCHWYHTDDDSNPGIFDGPYYACALERQTTVEAYQDRWNEVAEEIFNDSRTA